MNINIRDIKIKNRDAGTIITFVIGVFIIVYPFVSSLIFIELRGETASYLPSESGFWPDVFMLSKERFLFAFAVFITVAFICRIIISEKRTLPHILVKENRILFCLSALYLFFCIVSAALSDYKYVSFWGFPTESEGLAALIGYVILFLSVINYVNTDRTRRLFCLLLFILCVLVCIAALYEYFVSPVNQLVYGKYYTDDHRVMLMLGNPACFGSLCVLLFPFSLLYPFTDKSRIRTGLKLTVPALLIFGIMVSGSFAAIIGFAVEAAVLIMLVFIKYKKLRKIILLLFLACLVGLVILSVKSHRVTDFVYRHMLKANDYKGDEESYDLKSIDITDEGILITGGNESFIIPGNLEKAQRFTEETEINNIEFSWQETVLIIRFGYPDPIFFLYQDDKIYYIGINGLLYDKLRQPSFSQCEDYYELGTGRLYIHLSSLPLLKDCILIGKGAGSFVFYYPHEEIAGMLKTHGTAHLLTDKPHNMYLQTAINNGCTALVVLICIIVISLKKGISSIISNTNILGFAFVASCAAFAAVGLANDSAVSVSPLFWIILGLCPYNNRNKI